MTETQARMLTIMVSLLMILQTLVTVIVASTYQSKGPRLVGYGCENAGGPLYADEEDHFPRCKSIEANT